MTQQFDFAKSLLGLSFSGKSTAGSQAGDAAKDSLKDDPVVMVVDKCPPPDSRSTLATVCSPQCFDTLCLVQCLRGCLKYLCALVAL